MEKIIVDGSSRLSGEVGISGSKNSLSAILPAVCLKEKDSVFTVRNVPCLSDTECICNLLAEIGFVVDKDDGR